MLTDELLGVLFQDRNKRRIRYKGDNIGSVYAESMKTIDPFEERRREYTF